MTEPTEQKSLKEVLFETVDSFEELEILTWFHDHANGVIADAELLSQQRAIPADVATAALCGLGARGILSDATGHPGKFVYNPEPEKRAAIRRIILEYRADALEVMVLMASNAIERVRTRAPRALAESKRLKSNG